MRHCSSNEIMYIAEREHSCTHTHSLHTFTPYTFTPHTFNSHVPFRLSNVIEKDDW